VVADCGGDPVGEFLRGDPLTGFDAPEVAVCDGPSAIGRK
jgi:hypothetical protein